MNDIYPQGIYGLIGKGRAKEDMDINPATVDMGRVTVKSTTLEWMTWLGTVLPSRLE